MPERPAMGAAVVRHREAILVCRAAPGASARWTLPTAPVEAASPDRGVRPLLDTLGVDPGAVERLGEPVTGHGDPLVPVLVTADDRSVAPDGCPGAAWESPTVLRRQSDDRWWRAYAAVAPTVETVTGDATRGSTAIATDALWALRDVAAEAAETDAGLAPVETVAATLLDARPAMAALGNRVNRAMAGAATPAAVEAAATDGIRRAHEADVAAARLAAETPGDHVLTLSRSGTVRAALLRARPAVTVLASLPGGEGPAVAAELADAGLTGSTIADAAVYDCLRSGDVDAVLVGADAVTPDGGVVNKVGTWALAHAAGRADVPCVVACASDKIRPASGGPATVPFEARFDLTPPAAVSAICTERGRLRPGAVRAVAREHRALAGWRSDGPGA